MNPIIEKLKTKRYGNIVTIDKAYVVGHRGFNENDGFLAFYMIDSEIIGVSSGDDGQWKEIFTVNKWWLKEIAYILKYFIKHYNLDISAKEIK